MPESILIAQNKRVTVLPRGGKRFAQGLERISLADKAALIACKARWPEEDTEAVDLLVNELENHPEIDQFIASEAVDNFELPDCAALYALPNDEKDPEYRRFGGDGLFHSALISRHAQFGKIITVHLCEKPTLVAYVANGTPVDLIDGYSALSGLPGMTTCGEIDPSLIFYLLENGYTQSQVRDLLYHRSGWNAFCRIPITFQQLMTGQDPQLDVPRLIYFQDLVKSIGAMLAALGGADLILCGAETVAEVETMYDRICCHFQNNSLKFELIELTRESVLQELKDKILDPKQE